MTESSNPETPNPESPSSGGFDLGTVITQATQVIRDPVGFYRGMAKGGGYSEPLIFVLVMAVASGVVFGLLSIIGLTGAGAAGLAAIIVMPIGMLIGSFISAGIMFVVWKLMGSPQDYQTAYRCVAYSTAILPIVTVISVIPYLGTIVRTAWTVWLMIIASIEVHGRTRQTATLVLGILGALGLIMGLSGEYTQRNLAAELERNTHELEQRMQSLEQFGVNEDGEVDPEQVGRAVGEFIRGMEEAAREAEKAQNE